MPTIHLTDIVVSRLKEPGTYFDKSVPSFGVRIGKNRKTWIVVRGRERIRKSFGRYPDTPLADARKEARKLLTQPLHVKGQTTFQQAYDLFKVSLGDRKPRTQKDYKRHLEKHFAFGTKKLEDIAYEDIIDATKNLPPGEQAHAHAVARIFFRWCVRPPRRFIPHSPLEGLQIPGSNKRKRVLKDDELVAVWNAGKKQGYPHGTIVQLLILTGQRRGEIAGLRWPWIDEKEQTITLPEEITKNSKEHTFPYSDQVAAILETVPRRNSTDLLFPSRDDESRPVSGFSKFKHELGDGVEGWRLHDLRRTHRTLHAKIGTSSTIGERLINHAAGVTTEVEQIYDRYTYMPEMKSAVTAFEKHLISLLARK